MTTDPPDPDPPNPATAAASAAPPASTATAAKKATKKAATADTPTATTPTPASKKSKGVHGDIYCKPVELHRGVAGQMDPRLRDFVPPRNPSAPPCSAEQRAMEEQLAAVRCRQVMSQRYRTGGDPVLTNTAVPSLCHAEAVAIIVASKGLQGVTSNAKRRPGLEEVGHVRAYTAGGVPISNWARRHDFGRVYKGLTCNQHAHFDFNRLKEFGLGLRQHPMHWRADVSYIDFDNWRVAQQVQLIISVTCGIQKVVVNAARKKAREAAEAEAASDASVAPASDSSVTPTSAVPLTVGATPALATPTLATSTLDTLDAPTLATTTPTLFMPTFDTLATTTLATPTLDMTTLATTTPATPTLATTTTMLATPAPATPAPTLTTRIEAIVGCIEAYVAAKDDTAREIQCWTLFDKLFSLANGKDVGKYIPGQKTNHPVWRLANKLEARSDGLVQVCFAMLGRCLSTAKASDVGACQFFFLSWGGGGGV